MGRDEALIEALNAVEGRTIDTFQVMFGSRGEITSFIMKLDGGAALIVGFDETPGYPSLKGKAVIPIQEPYEVRGN